MDLPQFNPLSGLTPDNPMQSFGQGFATGNAILQSQLAQRKAEAQAAEAQAAADAEAQRQAEMQALIQKLKAPGATFEDYQKASMLLPKDQADAVQKAALSMRADQQQAVLEDTSRIVSAIELGRLDVASELLTRQAAAERSSKNEPGAKFAETLAQQLKDNPDQAWAIKAALGHQMAVLPGGKDAFDALNKLNADARINNDVALEQQLADLAKTRAETMKLLKDAQPDGLKIDEGARKLMNDSVTTAISADLVGSQADNLAAQIDKEKPPTGWAGKVWEGVKGAMGVQDKYTALKQEYTKLRNTEAIKMLPPGSASDKDVEIALQSFPDNQSNPDYISSFLRGMAKLQHYTASVSKAKAEWVNQNGSLGPAQVDFTAGGQGVKAGTPFTDFIKTIQIPNVAGMQTAQPASKPAASPSTFTVQAPDGNTYSFPDQVSLDAFKTKAGIK